MAKTEFRGGSEKDIGKYFEERARAEMERRQLKEAAEIMKKLAVKQAGDPILPPPVEAAAREFAKEFGGKWQDYVKDAEIATRGMVKHGFFPIDPTALSARGMLDVTVKRSEYEMRIEVTGMIAEQMTRMLKEAYRAYL